jgi:hypothetical protein
MSEAEEVVAAEAPDARHRRFPFPFPFFSFLEFCLSSFLGLTVLTPDSSDPYLVFGYPILLSEIRFTNLDAFGQGTCSQLPSGS